MLLSSVLAMTMLNLPVRTGTLGHEGARNTNAPAGMPAEATQARRLTSDARRERAYESCQRSLESSRRTTHRGRTARGVSRPARARVNDRNEAPGHYLAPDFLGEPGLGPPANCHRARPSCGNTDHPS